MLFLNLVRRFDFLFILTFLGPAQYAAEGPEARIQHQITDAEHERDVKQVQPPLGQRIQRLIESCDQETLTPLGAAPVYRFLDTVARNVS